MKIDSDKLRKLMLEEYESRHWETSLDWLSRRDTYNAYLKIVSRLEQETNGET